MLTVGDRYLIELFNKRDKNAFEILFKQYYPDLCHFAVNLVRNDSIAEDLVMEVFTRLWESEPGLNIKTSLSGYLYQSVYNKSINYLTREKKRFAELDPSSAEQLNSIVSQDLSEHPYYRISYRELNELLEKSIEQLPEECRKIFIMSRKEDLDHIEIAIRLGISENTVKVQIYRALKKLRILLKEFLEKS
jgi:RNA polymerase sigma-70 factor (ECF subfamily)